MVTSSAIRKILATKTPSPPNNRISNSKNNRIQSIDSTSSLLFGVDCRATTPTTCRTNNVPTYSLSLRGERNGHRGNMQATGDGRTESYMMRTRGSKRITSASETGQLSL